jgi:hypothetical protein
MSRFRVAAGMLAIVAAAAVVSAGVVSAADARRGSPDRRASDPIASGVAIQQSYDSAGDPSLIANAEVAGDKARPTWWVCLPPKLDVCAPARRGVSGYDTSAFLTPGASVPGSVFQAVLTTGHHSYVARTSSWLGTVKASSPPSLTGAPRAGGVVVAHGARWIGGWSGSLTSGVASEPHEPASTDAISVEACRTREGRACVNLTAQGDHAGFSLRPPMVNAGFVGWYLFAFDERIAEPYISDLVLYSSPFAIPVGPVGPTNARSAPLGPVTGPPQPTVAILRTGILKGGTVLVAHVHCPRRCEVYVSVYDRHGIAEAGSRLVGSALVGVPRRKLGRGRLDVSVQIDTGPPTAGHTDLP